MELLHAGNERNRSSSCRPVEQAPPIRASGRGEHRAGRRRFRHFPKRTRPRRNGHWCRAARSTNSIEPHENERRARRPPVQFRRSACLHRTSRRTPWSVAGTHPYLGCGAQRRRHGLFARSGLCLGVSWSKPAHSHACKQLSPKPLPRGRNKSRSPRPTITRLERSGQRSHSRRAGNRD